MRRCYSTCARASVEALRRFIFLRTENDADVLEQIQLPCTQGR